MTSNLGEVRRIPLQSVRDSRGVLTAVEGGIHTPFEIKRIFYMHSIFSDRGGHAHRDTDQVIIPVHGSFRVELLNARDSQTHELDDPTIGLYVPRMTFTNLLGFSPGAVALVLASTHYDMSRSIRTWEDYVQALEPSPS